MARKSKLLDFGERYLLIEHNGGYCLYDKEREAFRANYQFVGKFYLSTDNTFYVFNEDRYYTVQDLVDAMDAYNAKLPFRPENFDPTYRKNVQIEYCIADYLTGLGFTCNWMDGQGYGDVYKLKDSYGSVICELFVKANQDTTKGEVIRIIDRDRTQHAEFTNLDSAIGACNSLIAGHCALVNAQLVNVLNGLTKSRAAEVLDKTFDVKTLSTYTEDARKKTIESLEAELKRLKEN